MTDSSTEREGFRNRLRQRLNRFRDRSRDRLHSIGSQLPGNTLATRTTNRASISQNASLAVTPGSSPPNNETDGTPARPVGTEKSHAQIQSDQDTPHHDSLGPNPTTSRGSLVNDNAVPTDLWTAAYREAVETLGDELDVAILKGKNTARLFKELEEIDEHVTHESAFVRGVKYLHSIQVPLEKFKLALDLASPITNIEPTMATAFGAVRSVTMIAISFASADLAFAKQIGGMLEHISYIDDCDTLGQRTGKKEIHEKLVLVYQKILEFYKVSLEILTQRGARLVMKMVMENDRLPSIVRDFLAHSESLQRLVQNATLSIVDDIKTMLCDNKIASSLGSDKMIGQNQYHHSLQRLRADQACKFLLRDANFTKWDHSSGSRQLVILGDMGCGKTVAMTYLVDHLTERNQHQLPQPKICYYYCRDDNTGNAVSIFSCLVLSLLSQLPGLKKFFVDWYDEVQLSGILNPAANIEKLEELLQKLLEQIDRPIFIVIDGLDECDTISRNRLLNFMKSSTQRFSGLKVILSSRPQKEILEQLGGTHKIELRSNADRDRIIVEKTVEAQLTSLPPDVKELVKERLSSLAEGSGIWVKMIVNLIEVRRISAYGPMQRLLEEIPLPKQLSELYSTLLARYSSEDPENQELAITALKLLAASHRPFSILELAWAVTLARAQDVTTVGSLSELVDHQRVMSLIHPFISRVDFSDLRKHQVRVRHQSVKEFIMKEWGHQPHIQNAASTETANMASAHGPASLEAFILGICIRYLLFDDIGEKEVLSDRQQAILEMPQNADLFDDTEEPPEYNPYCSWETWEEDMIHYDPVERGFGEFFVYASCYWLEHFGAVTAEPLPKLADIEELCRAGSTQITNWIEQNCRPGCAVQPRFVFESNLYDPLSITALYGSDAILRDLLKNSNFDENIYFGNSAIRAVEQIIQWGDIPRLSLLFLDDRLGRHLQNLDFFRTVISAWRHPSIYQRDWDPVFDLVDYVSDNLVQEQWGNELLCVAASAGCLPIVRRLITSARLKPDLRSELLRESRVEKQRFPFYEPTHQSIGEAIMQNHVDVVEYLLAEDGIETHLRYRNWRGETVLHIAATVCNPEIFRLLTPRFPEGVHQVTDQGDTSLMRIIMNSSLSGDRYESARILLLESGTDWNTGYLDEQYNPLRAAVRLGDIEMCRLLICTGNVDPLSALTCDSEGGMILKDESTGNKENTLQILELLRTHVNIASQADT